MAEHLLRDFEGRLPANARFAIVVSRYNEDITSRLLDGAMETLLRHGATEDRVTIAHVPGAFEIPLVADRLARSGRYAAVLCLGAVIKGETTHDEYINHQVAAGIAQAARESGIPVLFGVLTCGTMQQALDRAGGTAGHKGNETAVAALEMVDLLRKIDSSEI